MDGLRFIVLGVAWWIAIEVIRRRSGSRSKGLRWLQFTAPLVTAACVGLGLWLIWAE